MPPPALVFIFASLFSLHAFGWPDEAPRVESSVRLAVRLMTPADAEKVASFAPNWSEEKLLARLNNPQTPTTPYVCESDGNVLGVLFYGTTEESFRITEIITPPNTDRVPVYKAFIERFRSLLGLRRHQVQILPGVIPPIDRADVLQLGFESRSNSALVLDNAKDARIAEQAKQIKSNLGSPDLYKRLGLKPDAGKLELGLTLRSIRRSGLAAHPDIVKAWKTISDEILRAKYDYEVKKAQTEEQELKDILRHLHLPKYMDPYHTLGIERGASTDATINAYLEIRKVHGADSENAGHALNALKILLSPAATKKLSEMMSAADPVSVFQSDFPALLTIAENDSRRAKEEMEAKLKPEPEKPEIAFRPLSESMHERLGISTEAGQIRIFNRFMELKGRRTEFSDQEWANIRQAFWILADVQRRHELERGHPVSDIIAKAQKDAPKGPVDERPTFGVFGVADPDNGELYARLGLSRGATNQLIAETYAALVEQHRGEWSEAQMRRVQDAKIVLTGDNSRGIYDRHFSLSENSRPTEEDIQQILMGAIEEDILQKMGEILKASKKFSTVQLRDALLPLLRGTQAPTMIADDLLQQLRKRAAEIKSHDDVVALNDMTFALDAAFKRYGLPHSFKAAMETTQQAIEENSAPFQRPDFEPGVIKALRAFQNACDSQQNADLN